MSNKSITTELLTSHPEYFSGEKNDQPSETVPGQAISAKDAVIKSFSNIPVRCMSTPQDAPYDGDEEHVDLDEVAQQPHFSDDLDVMDFRATLFDRMARAAQTAKQKETPAEDPSAKQSKNNGKDAETVKQDPES